MRFKITLYTVDSFEKVIPINYQYPLSAAIYKVLSKGDVEYAKFLHEEGYGKGYKFFTFSDLKGEFKIRKDRMYILYPQISFTVHFHLPEASQNFVEGLFKSEEIVIADQKTKAVFKVQSIVSLENPLRLFNEMEIIQVEVKTISAIVTGSKNERGNYDYKTPDDAEFISSLIYGWRNKIKDAFDGETSESAVLMIDVALYKNPFRTRLIHIKDGKEDKTKIRGSLNYKLQLTAERRFIDLVLNAGMGLYSAQGMGCLEVVRLGSIDYSKLKVVDVLEKNKIPNQITLK